MRNLFAEAEAETFLFILSFLYRSTSQGLRLALYDAVNLVSQVNGDDGRPSLACLRVSGVERGSEATLAVFQSALQNLGRAASWKRRAGFDLV